MTNLFSGEIKNVKKETSAITTGRVKTDYSIIMQGQDVKGSINTHLKTTITFNIDGKMFRIHKDYAFEDGDKVVILTNDFKNGYHEIQACKNLTKGWEINAPKDSSVIQSYINSFLLCAGLSLGTAWIIGYALSFIIDENMAEKSVYILTIIFVIIISIKFVPKWARQDIEEDKELFKKFNKLCKDLDSSSN